MANGFEIWADDIAARLQSSKEKRKASSKRKASRKPKAESNSQREGRRSGSHRHHSSDRHKSHSPQSPRHRPKRSSSPSSTDSDESASDGELTPNQDEWIERYLRSEKHFYFWWGYYRYMKNHPDYKSKEECLRRIFLMGSRVRGQLEGLKFADDSEFVRSLSIPRNVLDAMQGVLIFASVNGIDPETRRQYLETIMTEMGYGRTTKDHDRYQNTQQRYSDSHPRPSRRDHRHSREPVDGQERGYRHEEFRTTRDEDEYRFSRPSRHSHHDSGQRRTWHETREYRYSDNGQPSSPQYFQYPVQDEARRAYTQYDDTDDSRRRASTSTYPATGGHNTVERQPQAFVDKYGVRTRQEKHRTVAGISLLGGFVRIENVERM